MPLSEHEQRLLSAMEQQLVADDPKFAASMQGSRGRSRAGSRLALGGLAVVAGMAVLVLSVAFQPQLGNFSIVLAVVAFVGMLAGATFAFSRKRTTGPQGVVGTDGTTRPRSGTSTRGGGNSGMMQKLEERWARRRNEGGR